MYTLDGSVTVTVPVCIHVVPSVERKPVIVFPDRVMRTQFGIEPLALPPAVEPAPVPLRYWKLNPLEGVSNISTCVEFAASDSLIITPAFAHALVFVNELTLAVTVTFPEND
jgi:hypothetical protein